MSWSEAIKNKVQRKHKLKKQVFEEILDRDTEFDNTLAGLSKEVCQDITIKISTEFRKVSVNLREQNIRGVAAAAVGTCLRYSPCEVLNLRKNFIRCEDVKLITRNLHYKGTKLKQLDLSNNRIRDEGAEAIGNMLKFNKSLTCLNLDTNGICQGFQKIIYGLTRNTTLVSFSINWNDLAYHADEFYLVLTSNKCLEIVQMGYCCLSDSFAHSLATGLCQNTSLRELILFGNQFTDEAANILSEALLENKTLRYLNLKNNQIRDEGAAKLYSVIEQRGTELTINVKQNQVKQEISSKFEEVGRINGRKCTKFEIKSEISIVSDGDSKRQNTLTAFFNNRFFEINQDESEDDTDIDDVSDRFTDSESVEDSASEIGYGEEEYEHESGSESDQS